MQKPIAVLFAAPTASSPVQAETDTSRGAALVEEGMKLLFQSMLDEMKPALEEMGPKLQELGPHLRKLTDSIPDFSSYEMPEVLPNGDILIRKKRPAPEDGETDL